MGGETLDAFVRVSVRGWVMCWRVWVHTQRGGGVKCLLAAVDETAREIKITTHARRMRGG